MSSCPNCGKQLGIPEKKLENTVFKIALYNCHACGRTFKIIR